MNKRGRDSCLGWGSGWLLEGKGKQVEEDQKESMGWPLLPQPRTSSYNMVGIVELNLRSKLV